MKNIHQYILALSFLLAITLMVIGVTQIQKALSNDTNITYISDKPNAITTKTKGSNSMLPVIYPDTELMLREVNVSERLICGHIYIYRKPENYTVVHRFIYEAFNGSIYFKGDNNNVFDAPINRSQIEYEVIGINYLEFENFPIKSWN